MSHTVALVFGRNKTCKLFGQISNSKLNNPFVFVLAMSAFNFSYS